MKQLRRHFERTFIVRSGNSGRDAPLSCFAADREYGPQLGTHFYQEYIELTWKSSKLINAGIS